jgi:flagellar motor switch protein FliM
MASVAEVVEQAPAAAAKSGLIVAPHPGSHSGAGRDAQAPAAGPEDVPERRKRYWPAIEWLPVQISISLPIPRFRVRDLLTLDPGQIISTDWPNGDDLPLSVDQVQLAWVEMESVEQEMAVRITRLL